MLVIKNLKARIEEKEILKGFNLEVKAGEVHAIMGPNGSGKSTLASVLAGREDYEVTDGEVTFNGKDLLDMAPEERAREGTTSQAHREPTLCRTKWTDPCPGHQTASAHGDRQKAD